MFLENLKNNKQEIYINRVRKHYPLEIAHIKNPSQELQNISLKDSGGYSIKYIENPSRESIEYALEKCYLTLAYIKEYTEEDLIAFTKRWYIGKEELFSHFPMFKDKNYFTYIKLAAGL